MSGARNVGIILALAAIVTFVPGGGTAGSFVVSLLSVAFLASLAWFGSVFYREHRTDLFSLEPRMRALLYGSLAVAILTLIATRRLWGAGGGLGVLLWFVLIAAASIGVVTVYRAHQRY